MLAEAMSGFGKTAAVLCGTVAAAEETGCKIVYACRTKRQIKRVAEELSRLQRKHPIKAAAQSEVTVVPYPYVFDPGSKHAVFDSNETEPANTILVVDEAHNIRDFMRGLRSGSITLEEVDGAVKEASVLLMMEVASELRALKKDLETVMSETTGWYLDRDAVVARLAQEHDGVWLQNLALSLCSCSAAAWGSVVYERRFPSLILKVGEFLAKLSSSEGRCSQNGVARWESSTPTR